ncbi:uncharacterized protein LOC141900295 isoform X2 [Tubulanus polymorphus]|uniref:uncharacterized protein LOC141900295 isoform X2 n=1 Tax=Tubulanus polymorphus TaxID=672921 RepID=UPI003DA3FD14
MSDYEREDDEPLPLPMDPRGRCSKKSESESESGVNEEGVYPSTSQNVGATMSPEGNSFKIMKERVYKIVKSHHPEQIQHCHLWREYTNKFGPVAAKDFNIKMMKNIYPKISDIVTYDEKKKLVSLVIKRTDSESSSSSMELSPTTTLTASKPVGYFVRGGTISGFIPFQAPTFINQSVAATSCLLPPGIPSSALLGSPLHMGSTTASLLPPGVPASALKTNPLQKDSSTASPFTQIGSVSSSMAKNNTLASPLSSEVPASAHKTYPSQADTVSTLASPFTQTGPASAWATINVKPAFLLPQGVPASALQRSSLHTGYKPTSLQPSSPSTPDSSRPVACGINDMLVSQQNKGESDNSKNTARKNRKSSVDSIPDLEYISFDDTSSPLKVISTSTQTIGPPKCFNYEPIRSLSEEMTCYRQQHHINRDQLNAIAEDCIARLSEANQFVSSHLVEQHLLQRIQRYHLREVGLRNITDLECVRNLNRTQGKVSAYIQAYMMVRSIATLHDLQDCMKEFVQGEGNFRDLQLGPLARQPLVYQYFKVRPSEAEPFEISTLDVIKHLRDYCTKNSLWKERVTMEGFMSHLLEVNHTADPYEMGVVIKSLPLAMQVLKKATRDEAKMVREAFTMFQDELKEDIQSAFRSFRDKFLSKTKKSSSEYEIRRGYLEMSSQELLSDLNGKLTLLMASLAAKDNSRSLRRSRDVLTAYIKQLREDELLRDVMQLAICVGSQGFTDDILERLFPTRGIQEEYNEERELHPMLPPPPLEKLLESFTRYLSRCTSQGTLSLTMLSKVEEKLCEDFNRGQFSLMGYGSFLQFLHSQPDAKRIFEELGGSSLTVGHGHSASHSIYHATLNDVLDLMSQCGFNDRSKNDVIESAICDHYRVESIQTLGFGPMGSVLAKGEHHMKKNRDPNVLYECSLCPDISQAYFSPTTSKQVGILGQQTKERAFACLSSCPLLVDLDEWCNWSLVFQPQRDIGPLKHFIQKYGSSHDIMALEVGPGVLIKITSTTSVELFLEAARNADATLTCGHLVSIIVKNKGMAGAPLSLLANHMATALHHIQNSDGKRLGAQTMMYQSQDSMQTAAFVRDCLCVLPKRIAEAVACQVFLEPFSKVVGDAKSKQLLVESCQTVAHHNAIIRLGMALGVNEWSQAFDDRLRLPFTGTTTTDDDEAGMSFEEENSESESDSLSDSDTYESILDDVELSDEPELLERKAVNLEDDADKLVHATDSVIKSDENVLNDVKEENGDSELKPDKPEKLNRDETAIPDEMAHMTALEQERLEIINIIRRDEFGMGVFLSEDAEKLMRVQQERLGRSLERLSRDLYTRDTHFVLELIQNADDNAYPERTKSKRFIPSMQFIIDNDSVTILNNECGFKPEHMKALCDVGNSTKGKHKYGYIGQKGIGFKSVFRITDKPEVHSNGFHVCFDATSGPTGYILPHWIEDKTPETANKWMTKIHLPVKTDPENDAYTASLAHRFHDIKPSLLLFLHRLRSLSIINKIENSTLEMTRRDVGMDVVEIRHSNGIEKWLVVKKQLDASQISLQAKSGVDIESSEIALAFKLHHKDLITKVVPNMQHVFAYLPLRSYGFRFIIQGDFDVPSSREDVDRDSSWNQWLRNEIPELFIEALESFKVLASGVDDVRAVMRYLQFVPLEEEIVDPFFHPLATQIHQKLRGRPCLPTQPNANQEIEWKLPSQMVICPDLLVHEVITPTLLLQHLGLSYLHADVSSLISSAMLLSLGVQMLSSQHILDIGKSIAQQWEKKDSFTEDDIVSLAKWLVCIHRSLDEFQDNSTILNQIRAMKIFPLTCGRLISLASGTVFFPQMAGKDSNAKSKPSRRCTYGDYPPDVSILNLAILSCLDEVANPQIKRMLEELGVKHLNAPDVINHHIVPILKSDIWKDKDEDTLISYVIYLKIQLSKEPNILNLSSLLGCVPVKTNRGMKNPSTDAIHFTPDYENVLDLQRSLPGYSWVLLDACYLPVPPSRHDKETWTVFFASLGVLRNLSVRKRQKCFTLAELEKSEWAAVVPLLDGKLGPFKIDDYVCDEFYSLVTYNEEEVSHMQQMKTLYQWLSRQFSHLNKYLKTSVMNEANEEIKQVESTFGMQLTNLAWVPGIITTFTSMPNPSKQCEEKLFCGKELFVPNRPSKEYFDCHVTYLNTGESNATDLSNYLGMSSHITAEMVKNLLISWCRRDGTEKVKTFVTNLHHIKTVYYYLGKYLSIFIMRELFTQHPIIFVPIKTDFVSDGEEYVRGQFLYCVEVCWSDPTNLFRQYAIELEDFHGELKVLPMIDSFYQGMEDFFISQGKVHEQPYRKHYVELLECITLLGRDSIRNDVLVGLSHIATHLFNQGEMFMERLDEMQIMLTQKAIIPVKHNKFVSLDVKPMFADHKLEKYFINKEGIYFIDLESKKSKNRNTANRINKELVYKFLAACKVVKLSECLETQQITEHIKPCPTMQLYLHNIIPHVQRFLLNRYSEIYQQHVDNKIAAKLKIMKFYEVRTLEVVYTIKNIETEPHKQNEKCRITEKELFIKDTDLKSHNDLNKELSKFFSLGDQDSFNNIRDFLTELIPLTMNNSKTSFKDFYFVNSLDENLPSGETEWFIDPPVVQPPIIQRPVPTKINEPEEIKAATESAESDVLRNWPPGPPAGYGKNPTNTNVPHPTSTMWPPPRPGEDKLPTGNVDHSKMDQTGGFPLVSGTACTASPYGIGTATTADSRNTDKTYSGPALISGSVGSDGGAGHHQPVMNATHLPTSDSGEMISSAQDSSSSAVAGSIKRDNDRTDIDRPAKRPRSADSAELSGYSVQSTTTNNHSDLAMDTSREHPWEHMKSSELVDYDKTPQSVRKFRLNFDHYEIRDETLFEELHIPNIPEQVVFDKAADQPEIGNLGERLVHQYLKSLDTYNDKKILEVTWLNEQDEIGHPYDFVLSLKDVNGDEQLQYIEVKATVSDSKEVLEISIQQISCANELRDHYDLLRVFSLGNADSIKVCRIANLVDKLEKKQIRLCMVI